MVTKNEQVVVDRGVVRSDETVNRRRVYWGAIIAGFFFASMIQIVLTTLGLSIGLVTAPAAAQGGQGQALGIGAAIWLAISSLVAFYFGGWISSRMSSLWNRGEGALHGLLTWSVTTIVTLVFLTSAIGGMLGASMGLVSSAIQGPGQAAAQQQGQQPQGEQQQQAGQAQEQVQQGLESAQQMAPEAAKAGAAGAFGAFLMLALGGAAAAWGGSAGTRRH